MTKEEFRLLFDKYFDSVRSYLFYRGADAELASDLAQDVFLRLWEKQIDVLSDTAKRLLFKMAGDMFISKYRRELVENNFKASLTNDRTEQSPAEQLEYEETFGKYTNALASLSEKHRVVFLMARMEGLKYQEIADRLGLSVKAVEKRMSKTLALFKNVLGQ